MRYRTPHPEPYKLPGGELHIRNCLPDSCSYQLREALATTMPPRARRPQALDASLLANPISQPPHSAGTPLAGLKFKLAPAQIPSIVEEHYNDQERWHLESYVTAGTQPIPLATSEYYAIDQGQGSTTRCSFDKSEDNRR